MSTIKTIALKGKEMCLKLVMLFFCLMLIAPFSSHAGDYVIGEGDGLEEKSDR